MSDEGTIDTRRDLVRAQYARPTRLQTRGAVWRDDPERGSPKDAAFTAVVAAQPARVLELGCGTGEFAARIDAALPDAEVVATDLSSGMVKEARARGLAAQVVDATRLPCPDASFDVVCALWMLYHVPDLDRTLTEIRRVLRPDGRFVGATNGIEHTADLRALGGLPRATTQFMTETAHETLAAHFADTVVQRFSPVAVLDHAAAQAYIGSFAPDAAATVASYAGERTFHGRSCVITATGPRTG